MRELYRHLREVGARRGYLAHLAWRHRQIGAYLLIVVVSAYAFWRVDQAADTAKQAVAQVAKEERARSSEALRVRGQVCTVFETGHLEDVTRLERTYEFLDTLRRKRELTSTLGRAILAQLPETEKTARTDSAPDFCDEPNLGLPEPDPVLPRKRTYRLPSG